MSTEQETLTHAIAASGQVSRATQAQTLIEASEAWIAYLRSTMPTGGVQQLPVWLRERAASIAEGYAWMPKERFISSYPDGGSWRGYWSIEDADDWVEAKV